MIYKTQQTEKRDFWQKHVHAWRASGLSQSEYCRGHGLRKHRLTYYKLQDDKQTSSTANTRGNATSRGEKLFLPVKVADVTRGCMRVTLENGVSIDFDSGSDPVWVGRVLGSISP
jgi:hypothetical protein